MWSGLVKLGRRLGPAEWETPTDCPGWSVKDHFSHVVGTESWLSGIPAPESPAATPGHVRNPLGEANEAWVSARRGRPGAEVVAELEVVTAARLRRLASMTDDELATPGPSPIGEVPYEVFMQVRVMDCWVHEQDVRQALALPWRFDGPAAPVALDRLGGSFAYVVGRVVAPPEGSVVALRTTGPLARAATLRISGGRAVPLAGRAGDAADAAEGSASCLLETDTVTWVRLVTGRVKSSAVAASGVLRFSGNVALARSVAANLAQMP